ncbi:MAG TPA: aromatic hydrocarbon degradation protein [Epsilonproteobacteria bacterium]|nr:aromatic hydrocarbon degradation protein [Campylobacterota bacterium]
MNIAKTTNKILLLSLATSTILLATNGENLVGVGAKARGMAGAGIALGLGAESGYLNPALISSVEGTEISFGGTLFMPDIDAQIQGGPTLSSDADTFVIPSVSIAHKINENWYIGVGMWGTSGNGVDYSDATINPAAGNLGNFQMLTNLQILQFGVPITYKQNDFSIGISPILQYGALDIGYTQPTPTGLISVGRGVAQDFGFGVHVGLTYDFSRLGVKGLVFGATYKSAIDMDYNHQITGALGNFPLALPDGDHLEQPEEIGIGFSYTTGGHSIAIDYKQFKWASAKGYEDFGWEDQDVFAIGYQYKQDNWAVRLGYSIADDAIPEQDGNTPAGAAANFFNLVGFPAIGNEHIAIGGSYEFTERFSIDLSYVYQIEEEKRYNTSGLSQPGQPFPGYVNNTHSEDSVAFALNYKF